MDVDVTHAHISMQQRSAAGPVYHHQPVGHLQQPCGASFGFDGKLIQYFNVKQDNVGIGGVPDQRLVTVSQVVTLPEFIARSERFDHALESGNMAEFCQEKVQEVPESSEAKIWQFLQASFSSNPTQAYLSMLGFDPDEIYTKVNTVVGKIKYDSADAMTDGFVALSRGVPDGYGTQPTENGTSTSDSHNNYLTRSMSQDVEKHLFEIPTDDSSEGLVNQALLSGNTELAVELCLKDSRWVDALILASTGGPELIKKTQVKYFQKCRNETSNMIVAVVTRDLRRLVEHCDLNCWKEALATALTYSDPLGFSYLAETLGRRLESSKDGNFRKCALLCYICCGNINHLVDSWIFQSGKADSESPEHLQDVVEQLMVLKKAGETHGKEFQHLNQILTDKLVKYGAMLVSQGSLKTALKYISDSTDPSIVELKERVHVVLGISRPLTRQTRSRQPSESSMPGARHHHQSLVKRPSYPTPAVQQPSPVLSTYDSRRMSGFTDGPNISSLTGPPIPPHPEETMSMGVGSQGFYNSPLNVNTSYTAPVGYSQQQTPGASGLLSSGSSSYYPSAQERNSQRFSGSGPSTGTVSYPGGLPALPISSAAHGWNDPPQLKAKPKPSVVSQPLEAITHPIFGSAAPEPSSMYSPYGAGGDAYGSNSLHGYASAGPPPPSGPRKSFDKPPTPASYGQGQGPIGNFGMPPPMNAGFNSPPSSGFLYGMSPNASTIAPPPQGSNYGVTPGVGGLNFQPNQPPMSGGYGGIPPPPLPSVGSSSYSGLPQTSNYGSPPPLSSNYNAPSKSTSFGVLPSSRQSTSAPSPIANNASSFAPPPTSNWSLPPNSFNANAPPGLSGPPPMNTFGSAPSHHQPTTFAPPTKSSIGQTFGLPPSTGQHFVPAATPDQNFPPPSMGVNQSFPPLNSGTQNFSLPPTTMGQNITSGVHSFAPPPTSGPNFASLPPTSHNFAPPPTSHNFGPPPTSGPNFASLPPTSTQNSAPPPASRYAGQHFAPPMSQNFSPSFSSGQSITQPPTSGSQNFTPTPTPTNFLPPASSGIQPFTPTLDSMSQHYAPPSITPGNQNFGQTSHSAGQKFAPPPTSGGQNFTPPNSGGQNFAPPPTSGGQNFTPPNSGGQNFAIPPNSGGQLAAPPLTSDGPNFTPTPGNQNFAIPPNSGAQNNVPPPNFGGQNIIPPTSGGQNFAISPNFGGQNVAPPPTSRIQTLEPSISESQNFTPVLNSDVQSFAPPSQSRTPNFTSSNFENPSLSNLPVPVSVTHTFSSPEESRNQNFPPPTSGSQNFVPSRGSSMSQHSVPQPSTEGSALMQSSPNPSPIPSPTVATSGSFVSLNDQFASVSFNGPPAPTPPHIPIAQEAYPAANEPTAPPITTFGPPFAPPSSDSTNQYSQNEFFQTKPSVSFPSNMPPMMASTNPLLSQNTSQVKPEVVPIYAQSLPPLPQASNMSMTETNKTGIPAEHEELPKVLEELRNACHNAAGSQSQMKRKLEDVARKLEIFSDKLREGSLSSKTLASLHNMIKAVKNKDYHLALSMHTQLVTSGNFSEISSFLPAIKVLIQCAAQLGVFI